LISFTADPAQTILSTSYYGIQLFSSPAHLLASTLPVVSDAPFGPAYFVAGTSSSPSSTSSPSYVFKVATYNATSATPFNISFEGVAAGAKAKLTVLSEIPGDRPAGLSSNAWVNGTSVSVINTTVTEVVAGSDGTFEFELENYSLAVLVTE
jgi:alpha-N-arabinofuranosidase